MAEKQTKYSASKLFKRTISEYRPQLHRYLRSKLGNESDVEDIAQESFLRLLRIETPELIKRPQDYLFRIAANIIHDFYLKKSRQPSLIDYETAIESGADRDNDTLEDKLATRANVRRLEEMIKELPPKQRAAFLLKKRDGLRHDEIAKRLNISVHSSRAYVSRTLAYCRLEWEE